VWAKSTKIEAAKSLKSVKDNFPPALSQIVSAMIQQRSPATAAALEALLRSEPGADMIEDRSADRIQDILMGNS
jgi:hypothetical protein